MPDPRVQAFSHCTGLTHIRLPAVSSIGDSLFEGCIGLQSIDIPQSITKIGAWAFAGCQKIAGVRVPAAVTCIGHGAFSKCDRLAQLILPNNVAELGPHTFNVQWLDHHFLRSLSPTPAPQRRSV